MYEKIIRQVKNMSEYLLCVIEAYNVQKVIYLISIELNVLYLY